MNGVNSIHEADRSPLYLFHECVCKVCYATETSLKKHYKNLIKFASK